MPRAIKIFDFDTALACIKIVIADNFKIYYPAYDTAGVLGYPSVKSCIRNHAIETELVAMQTNGGIQSVKCMSYEDVLHIGFRTRNKAIIKLLESLSVIHKSLEVDTLKCEVRKLREDNAITTEKMSSLKTQIKAIIE